MNNLLAEVRSCTVCKSFLPFVPRPILQGTRHSKIVIIGQAPGQKAHDSEIPWNDASGNLLREWLGVSKEVFYDEAVFCLMPMGFCYPGKGASGDIAPRPECAPLWHQRLLRKMKEAQLILLIGQYSQKYYLKETGKENLTETVRSFSEYLPKYMPLPHPSPRNRIWLKKNSWFGKKNILALRKMVHEII